MIMTLILISGFLPIMLILHYFTNGTKENQSQRVAEYANETIVNKITTNKADLSANEIGVNTAN